MSKAKRGKCPWRTHTSFWRTRGASSEQGMKWVLARLSRTGLGLAYHSSMTDGGLHVVQIARERPRLLFSPLSFFFCVVSPLLFVCKDVHVIWC